MSIEFQNEDDFSRFVGMCWAQGIEVKTITVSREEGARIRGPFCCAGVTYDGPTMQHMHENGFVQMTDFGNVTVKVEDSATIRADDLKSSATCADDGEKGD